MRDQSFFLPFLYVTYVKRSVYDYFSIIVPLTLNIYRSRKTDKLFIFRHPNSTTARKTNY